ncbi:hypothetical protein [Luteibacter sp. E-22]|uniref:hypothetical protein n=1 Tax=Luteibacter sp. E-22 TaxID=3404050 RepID=UPI003CF1BA03
MDMRRYALALLFGMTAMLSCGTVQSSHRSPIEPKAIAHIRFYDKGAAEGHNFCTVSISSLPYVYSGGFFGCTKDEAVSAKLQDLPPGTRIVLYDDPDCGDSDDYAVITIKQYVHDQILGHFAWDLDTPVLSMSIHRHDGLAGKVSCAEVDAPGPNPVRTKMAIGEPPAK